MTNTARKRREERKEVEEFLYLAALTKSLTGINLTLTPKNQKLLQTRLAKLNRIYGPLTNSEIIKRIKGGDKIFASNFVSVITTNTTHFFRESAHFDFLKRNVTPYLKNKLGNELRVWCAACSTGQEPYSIAIQLAESLQNQLIDLHFLASDIDPRVLRFAKNGIYTKQDMEKMPPLYVTKYFDIERTSSGKIYTVKKKVRNSIRFAQFNLLSFPFPFQHKFDIIFCRNVFIYFERPTVYQIVEEMLSHLNPGGLLFLGHSEALVDVPTRMRRRSVAVYEKI